MLEKVGSKDIVVRDYVDGFNVKEYIQSVLIPRAFPTVPVTKLNAGFTGIVNEYLSQLAEDGFATASLMLNENFITRSIMPNSIYSEAGLFDLGYTFATPSRCQFALQLWIDDILQRGQTVGGNTGIELNSPRRSGDRQQFILDRDTKVIVGDNVYRLDYDIIIEWQARHVNGRDIIPFKARYDIPDKRDISNGRGTVNSIAITSNRWIKCRVTRKGWLVLLLTLQEFTRKVTEETISDNLRTTNSDIFLRWSDQIAGLDLVHVSTGGTRTPMRKKIQYTDWESEPFVYYGFQDDHTIRLNFSPAVPAWRPRFNDRIEATIYTTRGSAGNFDSYDVNGEVAVEKTGDRYEYNADAHIVALCYSGSTLGTDKKDIELLRSDVKTAYNTVKVLSTDHDLEEWFLNFAKRHDTRSTFFKRRDDPTGRLFSQFVAITKGDYVYPTNTLTIEVDEEPSPGVDGNVFTEFDYVDDDSNEFIIKPGHLWEYRWETITKTVLVEDPNDPDQLIPSMVPDPTNPGNVIPETYDVPDLSRTTVVMCKRADGRPAMIHDNPLPPIDGRHDELNRPFMFVNPFLIKIHRNPAITACYNYLIHHASHLDEELINDATEFRHFQLSTFTVDRTLIQRGKVTGDNHVDRYTIRVLVNPILPQDSIDSNYRYVEGSIDDPHSADYTRNNLRLVLVFDTRSYGDTGYVEMYPSKLLDGNIMEYEVEFAVHDNIDRKGYLAIDVSATRDKLLNETINVIEDVRRQQYRDTVIVEAEETMFKVVSLLKVDNFVEEYLPSIPAAPLYGDPNFSGYQVTNVFANDPRELTLYKPMSMMRSTVTFAGKPDHYQVRSTLMPFVGYRLALDAPELSGFIQRFNEQYASVEPVIFERLDNNCHLDFKLYATYGRSNNYYIGDDETVQELLGDLNVSIWFQLAVHDRMSWSATADSVKVEIMDFFSELNSDGNPNIYISNLIRRLETNNPNISHLRFNGIAHYDAREQFIRVRYQDVSDLDKDNLSVLVPELLQCRPEDIHLVELN